MNIQKTSTQDLIKRFLNTQADSRTFIYNDFLSCGNYKAIRSAVVHLCKTKHLVRLCQGVYVKPNRLGQYEMPSNIHLVREIDRRMGGVPVSRGTTRDFELGKIEEQPEVLSFFTTTSSRQLTLPDGTLVKMYHRS